MLQRAAKTVALCVVLGALGTADGLRPVCAAGLAPEAEQALWATGEDDPASGAIALAARLSDTDPAPPGSSAGASAPRAFDVTFDADELTLDFSSTHPRADLGGDVRLFLMAPGLAPDRAVVRARDAVVDLQDSSVCSADGISMATRGALLNARCLRFDSETRALTVEEASGVLDTGGVGGVAGLAHIYISGREVSQSDGIVEVTSGRLTTCSHENADFAVSASRLRYHLSDGKLEIWSPRVRLLGLNVPLYSGRVAFRIGRFDPEFKLLPIPRYSSRDGLYMRYRVPLFGDSESPASASANLRLGLSSGIRGSILGSYEPSDGWQMDLALGYKEEAYDDLGRAVMLNRLPELSIRRQLAGSAKDGDEDDSLILALSLGRLREGLWDNSPPLGPRETVSATRATAELRYQHNERQRIAREGHWYGTALRQSYYGGGDSYRDLAVWAGIGRTFGDRLNASITAIHHFTAGSSPFLLDRANIETELQPAAEVWLTPTWSVGGAMRYDVAALRPRDWEATLSRRAHCLTWRLTYDHFSRSVGLRVDINGLTGRTRAPEPDAAMDALLAAAQADLDAGPSPRPFTAQSPIGDVQWQDRWR